MTTWMLLRGLTRDARHWGHFVPLLQARWPEARVVAIDLPGNGLRNAERSPASVDAMAEACRAELRRQGIATPVQVLAMSLGAMVAVAWAERHPEELASAVLINTSLRPFSPMQHRLRPANWPRLLRLLLGPASEHDWERAIHQLTTRHADAAVLADWVRWRREHPVRRADALRQLLAALRYRAPRRAPQVALQLLASRGDALVDPRCSAALAAQWQCPIAWHPSAGHDLPLDDPDWVIRQLTIL